RYNGNIAETDWATQSDGTLRRYSYEYDGVNRLKAGNYWDNSGTAAGSYAERLNYDLNGNITGLRRTGLGAGLMDELGYSYENGGNSNRLMRVSDASGNAAGYPVGGNVIGYDVNGNMVSHLDKGISNIVYNYLNLPSSINASIGNTDYVYRADGVKLKKVFGAKTTDYLDGFQYENGVLQFVPTAEGYFDVIKNRYIYNYTDHLGNVRLSYTKGASGGAEIIEENNYYPFGLKHEGYNNASLANTAYQYKYNGKELQETGMYDYGARMYMPDLGRWGVIDPLTESSRRWSPYTYAYNNPIRFIDPDGRSNQDIIKVNSQGYVQEIIPQAGPHVVQDMEGNQLNLNDPAFDQKQLQALVDYAGTMSDFDLQDNEVRLFTPYSSKEMSDSFNNLGIGDINNTARSLQAFGEQSLIMTPWMLYMGWLGHGDFDFAGEMSALVQKTDNAYNPIQGGGATPPDGAGGFVRFEGTNTLYNVYDAGNFKTGKAFQLIGAPLDVLKNGANVSSKATLNGPDSKADQQAITNGYNYNRVKWKK
ncbi:RHS repeat domain-containing protein, partial [Elizabethkingia meningoseptica]